MSDWWLPYFRHCRSSCKTICRLNLPKFVSLYRIRETTWHQKLVKLKTFIEIPDAENTMSQHQ